MVSDTPLYRYYPQAPSNEVAQKWADWKAAGLAARDKVPLKTLIVRQRQANESVSGVSGRWTHVVVIGTEADLEAAKAGKSLPTPPKVAQAAATATSSDEPTPEFEPESETNGPPVDPSSPSSSDAAPSPPAAEEKPKRRRATR